MKHIISALVENKPGVLAHVAGMFAARGFNIDSLVVGRTDDPELSRMTIVVIGDDRVVEQVRKQLAKIVPVVKVQDFVGQPVVARDLMLIVLSAPPEKRPEILALIEVFRAKVNMVRIAVVPTIDEPASQRCRAGCSPSGLSHDEPRDQTPTADALRPDCPTRVPYARFESRSDRCRGQD